MAIEEILQKAIELSLPDFLKWLVASGVIAKLTKDQLEKVYTVIRNKHNEGRYGFVPDKEEAYTLKKLSDKSVYKDFKQLLKGHWGVDVVRTGLYINILEHKGGEAEKIKNIKNQIFKNKKISGLRLIEMVTEGVIRAVLDHLKNLNKYNYSREDIQSEFESLLSEWKEITIFVKNEDSIEGILKQAKEKIDKKEETFFILAKGNAITTACSVIVQLQKDKYLIEKGYVWFSETDPDTTPASYYCGIHSSTFLL
jgi:hypothetical protein